MRILLVSQFWPSAEDPDYGTFVAQLVERLEARGHTVDRAVVDHRGAGRVGDVRLLGDAMRSALGRKPDVVFAHFLVPTGLSALLGNRAPLVVMAHGTDVANAERLAPDPGSVDTVYPDSEVLVPPRDSTYSRRTSFTSVGPRDT